MTQATYRTFKGPSADIDLFNFVEHLPLYIIQSYAGRLNTPERTITISWTSPNLPTR